MGGKTKNIIQNPEKDTISKFPELDLHYLESRGEIWNKISARIDSNNSWSHKSFSLISYRLPLAASIFLILGITAFLRFHTTTILCPPGEHLTLLLPDSSKVELNAQSSVKYHPYWMKANRLVNLEGEALFKVKPGKAFKVISTRGETIVLGTSFNIYARDEDYNVSCFTGAVKVISSIKRESVILHPNQEAVIKADGTIKFVQSRSIEATKAWTENMFIFTAAPLKFVIREIERQYNIRIETHEDYNMTYTGNFNKSISEKDVLDLVCKSLELKFEAKSKGEYLIYKN